MGTWFIGDCHFFHENVIKFGGRPFKDIEEMNSSIIKNWNRVVKPKDEIYVLGDFSFGNRFETEEILKQLKGKKYLLKGNHDEATTSKNCAKYFVWIKDYHEIKENGNLWVLSHYPYHSWNKRAFGAIHVHAHSHKGADLFMVGDPWMGDDPSVYNRFICCSSDSINHTPISMDEIKDKFKIPKRKTLNN